MVSLLDIATLTERVRVRGADIEVYALTAEGLANLLAFYPNIADVFAGKKEALSPAALVTAAPDAIAFLIALVTTERDAYDTGSSWREAIRLAQKAALKLSVADQLSIVSAAFRLTFAEGPGPFVAQIQALTSGFTQAAEAIATEVEGAPKRKPKPETPTPTSSTPSQEDSPDVLEPDTPHYELGNIPRVKSLPGANSSNPNKPLAIEELFLPRASRRQPIQAQ